MTLAPEKEEQLSVNQSLVCLDHTYDVELDELSIERLATRVMARDVRVAIGRPSPDRGIVGRFHHD